MINFEKLLSMQKELRSHIYKEHPEIKNDPERCDKLILALNVETAECANETRCFKFWSNKKPSEREIILEECVDILHFILEIAIEIDYNFVEFNRGKYSPDSLTKAFNDLFESISDYRYYGGTYEFNILVDDYIRLYEKLEFTPGEIEKAYISKNEINHKRQVEKY